ncbi:ABC transporter ATP-binding protein [Mesorhizobium sp. M2D.F.Ca.ET.185.01.1.1]|uniref:ABC transporter ATP-binding protein n=1 Tax=unclassified Mesorhizobium TaxID=325217 RepID=UPI000FCCA0F0|nr:MULTISPECIES: ABC transporter ATP-binding protein [unclassified Mesorhizobium]TGP75591.1 ABC transporter ATP-binding protein [bacterium M00.F.Ca.ET.227.01.1.1]TGP87072.1 ABC transporter ATP-binding protein [bacterium M00.F.Ca.ET.221.01.1.1]TGP91564.1 ABC transporter ATP-binding protein [bacterium M00.F.Ca.ET.222.01.1.1]TGU04182.1 ABC transporter ATP-binding protein [bacterium M00.F.Ca.ET.163.01.1.1]TGU23382.1 ABC transporter ATP-binding protein [bacterium M00.F.Ca.ET.156.01.1.1]TGU44323.1 
MHALEAHELYRFFHIGDDETAALRGISFHLSAGEIVALVGPSGSGKSTLLSCVTGLDEPDGGHVEVAGMRLTRRSETERTRIRAANFGILPQSGNLFGHLNVEQNLRLQMQLAGKSNEIRIGALLESVDLRHRARAFPTELSGGETARAGLAVALAADPPILVADEPTAEVDRDTELRLIAHFEARRRAGLATLLATHSQALARKADRIIGLKDGRIDDE